MYELRSATFYYKREIFFSFFRDKYSKKNEKKISTPCIILSTMETLITLVKTSLGDRVNEYGDEEYLDIFRSFLKHYWNVDPDKLKFVANRLDSTDPLVVFKLEKELICCSNDLTCSLEDACECCYWRSVKCITLDQMNQNINDDLQIVGKNKYNTVTSIDLYPFEQTEEMSLVELGFDEALLEKMEYDQNETDYNIIIDVSIVSHTWITIGHNSEGITYYVYENGIIQYGFIDTAYNYQNGDGETNVYRYEDSIIIQNYGDVSSVVVFHF